MPPDPSPAPIDVNGIVTGTGTGTTTGTADPSHDDLRKVLGMYGISLPINPTPAELEAIAKKIVGLQGQLRDAQAAMAKAGLNNPNLLTQWTNIAKISSDLSDAGQQFQTYAGQYASEYDKTHPKQGQLESTTVSDMNTLFKQFQTLTRPAVPQVARLPSPEEFLSDFNTAYDTVYNEANLEGAGLSPEERDWAKSEYKASMLQRYTGEMGKIAQSGQSPFFLSEVGFNQRYPGEAGSAMEAARGPGPAYGQPTVTTAGMNGIVSQPGGTIPGEHFGVPFLNLNEIAAREKQAQEVGDTRTAQEMSMLRMQLGQETDIQAAQLRVDEMGSGTPRDFVALPKIDPTQWLSVNLDPAQIKLEYEGSRTGAGRRYLMGGQVSAKLAGPQS